MSGPLTADSDVPPTRGQTITVPHSAALPLTGLHRNRQLHVAAFLTHAANILRRHPAAPMDPCLNRGTCLTVTSPKAPCCLLCALDAAVLRHTIGTTDAVTTELVQSGTIAKQLAIDTIEANPHNGGEVFVLEHLATLIHAERLGVTLTPGETA